MLNTIIIVVLMLIVFIGWRLIAFSANTQKRDREIIRRLESLVKLLQSNKPIPQLMIEKLVRDPLIRRDLYQLLSYHKKEHLFPKEFSTDISLAESDLVRYLLHANELGSVPEVITYVREVKEKDKIYYIFKYKPVDRDRWYVGIAGSTTFSGGHEYSEEAVKAELSIIRKNIKNG